jgi:undecaprenyl pyrophosphate phosphatase UppP
VQGREDGIYVDQIVLSAERYLTAAPGASRSDATIVPRTQ